MDPTELGRWSRFAGKGGIGKCTAVQDCVAESMEDLMFLKGDDIIVLMQLPEQTDAYLGFCEGVVGRFEGSHVRFHAKLKKPIVARRASAASSLASGRLSPTASSRVSSPFHDHDVAQFRSIVTLIETHSASGPLDLTFDDDSSTPPLASDSSSSSAVGSAPTTPADFDELPNTKPDPADESLFANDSLLYPSSDSDIPDTSFDPSEPSTRISVATCDGMEGIGLSLLQNFMSGGGDDSSSDGSGRSDTQTPEPRPPDSPDSTVEDSRLNYDSTPPPLSPPVMPAAVDRSDAGSQMSSHPSENSEYTGDEWEGASDIYDNYRYSRFSIASKMSRHSKGSMQAPPPVPTDLRRRASVDSQTSQAKRPAPLDFAEPSPLLHTSFGSPTSPTGASAISAPTHSGDVTTIRSRLEINPAQPMIIQTDLAPEHEGQIVIVDDENEIANIEPVNRDSLGPASSEDRHHASLVARKQRSEEKSPTFVVVNEAPPPPYSPSAVISSFQPQQLKSPQGASSLPSPGPPPQESLPPARPRPRAQHPISGLDFGSSRTSMFLPHPGAPKAPGTAPSGPLYGRVLQLPHSPLSPTGNAFGPTSLVQLLRMAGTIRYYPNGAPRQLTFYGMCDEDLATSIGPVPITFSLEPPMSVPANRIPSRSQASSPHIHQAGLAAQQESQYTSGWATEPMEVTGRDSVASMGSPSTNKIPRANFFPQTPASRPRSRSFSGFDSSLPDSAGIKENDSSLIAPSTPTLGRRLADSNSNFSPSSARNSPPFDRQPSPLSLPRSRIQGPVSPIIHKPHSTSSPLSKSFSPPPAAHPHTPSLLTTEFGPDESPSQMPLRKVVSSASLRNNSAQSTPSPQASSVVLPCTPTLQPRIPCSDSDLGESNLSSASHEKPSIPLSPTPPRSFNDVSSLPDEPRPSMSSSSSSSENTRLETRQSITTVTESITVPQGSETRMSVDTDISRYSSEERSTSVVSPSPTTSSLSHLQTHSIVTKTPSARSGLSSSAIRAKSEGGRTSQDDVATPIEKESRYFETVQVEDMDFELVKPSLQRVPSPQPSMDPLGARAWDNGSQHSPVKLNGSFLRTDSPATSMVSSRSPALSDSEVSLSLKPPLPLATSPSNDSMSPAEVQAHRQRELKWVSLMSSLPPAQAKKSKKVKKLLLEGVPASVRYQVWAHLADCKGKRMNGLYPQLVKRGRVLVSPTIEHDAEEYFGDQPQSKDGSVVSVLQAYINMVPDIRYNRGLTSIVGRLLDQAPEEDAFWIFISMMDAYLRPYFASTAVQMEVDASLFVKALEANDPALAKKIFVDMAVPSVQICRSWFVSLFFDALPVEYHVRAWDVFLFEGIPFLFRMGLALFSCCRRALLESQGPERVVAVLLRIPLPCLPSTPDALIELAMSIKLKDDDVRKHRSKMEAQLKRQIQGRKSTTNGGVAPISSPRG